MELSAAEKALNKANSSGNSNIIKEAKSRFILAEKTLERAMGAMLEGGGCKFDENFDEGDRGKDNVSFSGFQF